MRIPFLLLAVLATQALAAGVSVDEEALALADSTPVTVERLKGWRLFGEAAAGSISQRQGVASLDTYRLSLDFYLDKTIASGMRGVFSDRYDRKYGDDVDGQRSINSLREAYLSWQANENQFFEMGRINIRNGVAVGYNPTDFFRTGAARSIVSIDPGSLKTNRLGSVVLKTHTLWSNGSFSAIYSPRLSRQAHTEPFSLDLGATNFEDRWLLGGSYKVTDYFNPQFLLYQEISGRPQAGVNVTGLLSNASVAYLEWSGGKGQPLISRSGVQSSEAFHSRLSTGLTHTFDNKISLTLEYQYNGLGLDRQHWNELRQDSPESYSRYRSWVRQAQDLPTKRSIFLYSVWQDALVNRLDLTAMARLDQIDHSRLLWAEARYRRDFADFLLQWQFNSGSPRSNFGASQHYRIVQLLIRHYF